eukprot:2011232-Pyramimonas_sp.AAC.1
MDPPEQGVTASMGKGTHNKPEIIVRCKLWIVLRCNARALRQNVSVQGCMIGAADVAQMRNTYRL